MSWEAFIDQDMFEVVTNDKNHHSKTTAKGRILIDFKVDVRKGDLTAAQVNYLVSQIRQNLKGLGFRQVKAEVLR